MQQAYHAYPQNKGTLVPGQTISVNNYTVQVERYLSQGTNIELGMYLMLNIYRWICTCIPCSDTDSCVQYNASCPQTNSGRQ